MLSLSKFKGYSKALKHDLKSKSVKCIKSLNVTNLLRGKLTVCAFLRIRQRQESARFVLQLIDIG